MLTDVSYISNTSFEPRKVRVMAKYKDLVWRYPLHFIRFNAVHDRVKRLGLECDFRKTYDDFKKFIEAIGPVPADMERPSVGRIDHSKGYVFDLERDQWNFRWQSMVENGAEASRRSKAGVSFSGSHKAALSEAAKKKFETTDAAQKHSERMRELWSTEESRNVYLNATSNPDAIEKRAAKMRAHWSDEAKREQWIQSLSEGQKKAWGAGKYDNSGFITRTTCPVCGQEGNLAPMKRWHFDNCRQRAS